MKFRHCSFPMFTLDNPHNVESNIMRFDIDINIMTGSYALDSNISGRVKASERKYEAASS